MNIHIFPNELELNEAAAGIITSLVQTKPHAALGLATGSTPIGIYAELARLFRKGRVSYRHAHLFNLDEYVGLSPHHPQSYAYYMQTHLFQHIDAVPEHIHIPRGMATDLVEECTRYDELLAKMGQLDLQLLGLGHNGHIGFNEPDHALISGTHVVHLSELTRAANARFFDDPQHVPQQAITMGVGTILKAKTILFVIKGADKADILHQALTGDITTACPASLLHMHPHLVVLADREAGRKLS